MGIYMFINDLDIENKRSVKDKDINDLLQEALLFDKSLMISEFSFKRKTFFKTEIVYHYNVFHECFLDGKTTYEARQQLSACGDKKIVMAYLYGIINGYKSAVRSKTTAS